MYDLKKNFIPKTILYVEISLVLDVSKPLLALHRSLGLLCAWRLHSSLTHAAKGKVGRENVYPPNKRQTVIIQFKIRINNSFIIHAFGVQALFSCFMVDSCWIFAFKLRQMNSWKGE